MRKLIVVAVAAVGLAACTWPQTKMQPVGETQLQTQNAPPPAPAAPEGKGSS